MELKEVLEKRRSIRRFTEEPVSREEILELMRAGMSGPSACNKQPWEFYAVTDPDKLEGLRKATRFGNYRSPLAIVVCGNLARALPLKFSAYWIQDCSAATENILLRVTDLGLGAVWCGAHPQKRVEDKIRACLDLPDKQIPLNILFIGHPAEEREAGDWYDQTRVHFVE